MKGNTREKSRSQVRMYLKTIFQNFSLKPKTIENHGKIFKQENGMMQFLFANSHTTSSLEIGQLRVIPEKGGCVGPGGITKCGGYWALDNLEDLYK